MKRRAAEHSYNEELEGETVIVRRRGGKVKVNFLGTECSRKARWRSVMEKERDWQRGEREEETMKVMEWSRGTY